MKFGGSVVVLLLKFREHLVTESGEPTFIVLSAMSGTTNSLVEISDYLYKKNPEGANEVINNLEKKYMQHVEELYSTEEMKNTTREPRRPPHSKHSAIRPKIGRRCWSRRISNPFSCCRATWKEM